MKNEIVHLLKQILAEMGVSGVEPEIEIPENPVHGDYSTAVALKLAKILKKPPMDIALQVKSAISHQPSAISQSKTNHNISQTNQKISLKLPLLSILRDINHVEVVSPGFINFFLTEVKLSSQVERVIKEGEAYGSAYSSVIARSSALQNDEAISKNNFMRSPRLDKVSGLAMTGRKIMVEFAHPNTHKAFHIGHLRNITTGESVIRLLEASGHKVIRSNYEGDVGMHIAKCVYALMNIEPYKTELEKYLSFRPPSGNPDHKHLIPDQARDDKKVHERVEFLGKAYAAGSTAFEAHEKAKETIKDFNYLIYAAAQRFQQERGIEPGSTDYLSFVKGRKDEVNEVYELWKETRQWSLDYFDSIYKRVGSHFDRLYFESECLAGVDRAKEAVKKGILKESEGAIIFDGKPFGIDTRVFVNSLGLPTYEGKELALAPRELSEFGHLDRIIHVVGPEQASFFKVTFKAEELLGIQKDQQYHFIYGWVKLKHGKMSSRTGQVVLGEWLLDEVKKEIYNILQKSESKDIEAPRHSGHRAGIHLRENEIPGQARNDSLQRYSAAQMDEIAEKAAVAAVKYSFLRVAPQNTIAFDLKESVSFEGDSGPYLQYTYARCRSVLRKAKKLSAISNQTSAKAVGSKLKADGLKLNLDELAVARLIFHFPEIVADASASLAPNMLCSYLFKLAQSFNLFYAKHSILGKSSLFIVQSKKAKIINHEPLTMNQSAGWRIALTAATAQVLKNGLYLLGIETLEKM